MKVAHIALLTSLACSLLTSCLSSPKSKDYHGYKTKPYKVGGKQYCPMSVEEALTYSQTGIASHYNETWFWGWWRGDTALGEKVHSWHVHAAHPTLPLPCEVKVTSLRTGKSLIVRVNDRGPFIKNRLIDLSEEAADRLGITHLGLAKVHVEVISVGDGKWKRYAPPRAELCSY